ncbi:thymidylate kinase [Methanobacterium alcaliphilum]|uniref:thymidylate kinase n=1 Tax=Methanobacterium alcaliphilum TaxID=392018 RepID=UPI002009FF13|nr:thymidylate kinase [Methanobacterium alcaliphilum]MCK9150547.1 thymidylate kinase [Methanobacterium alcaliphilum]
MRFIIIDGLDGAGKDTHAQLIVEKYVSQGENVIFRSHPESDNQYGIKAKEALLGKGKLNHIKASFYYALDVIRSLKLYHDKSADTLIFSRYLLGVAYLPNPLDKVLYKILAAVLPTTHYMFFLDVAPEESLNRVSQRDEHEMFENMDDLVKTRQKALDLVNDWHIINTCGSIESVQKKIDIVLEDLDKKYD